MNRLKIIEWLWGKNAHMTIFAIWNGNGYDKGIATHEPEKLSPIFMEALKTKGKFREWLLKIVGDYLICDEEQRRAFVKYIYNQN